MPQFASLFRSKLPDSRFLHRQRQLKSARACLFRFLSPSPFAGSPIQLSRSMVIISGPGQAVRHAARPPYSPGFSHYAGLFRSPGRRHDPPSQFSLRQPAPVLAAPQFLVDMRIAGQIRNIRAYLLTALYNAPITISQYYQAEVQHDFGAINTGF